MHDHRRRLAVVIFVLFAVMPYSMHRQCRLHYRSVEVFINLRLFGIGCIYSDDVFLFKRCVSFLRLHQFLIVIVHRSHASLIIYVVLNLAVANFLCVPRPGDKLPYGLHRQRSAARYVVSASIHLILTIRSISYHIHDVIFITLFLAVLATCRFDLHLHFRAICSVRTYSVHTILSCVLCHGLLWDMDRY